MSTASQQTPSSAVVVPLVAGDDAAAAGKPSKARREKVIDWGKVNFLIDIVDIVDDINRFFNASAVAEFEASKHVIG